MFQIKYRNNFFPCMYKPLHTSTYVKMPALGKYKYNKKTSHLVKHFDGLVLLSQSHKRQTLEETKLLDLKLVFK